jgi:ribosomal protein S1
VLCVIVSDCEHGLIVKTFGNIKGLLTYEDIKQKEKNVDMTAYKPGTVIKAYVLFKKKDKGVALTLSKKKAKAESDKNKIDETTHQTIESHFLPTDEVVEQMVSEGKYATALKASRDEGLVGKVNRFRIIESFETYHVVRSTDAEKKSKNFIGLLPKCLVSNFSDILNLQLTNESQFSGVVMEIFRDSFPIISA